jgi:hypothetical protein
MGVGVCINAIRARRCLVLWWIWRRRRPPWGLGDLLSVRLCDFESFDLLRCRILEIAPFSLILDSYLDLEIVCQFASRCGISNFNRGIEGVNLVQYVLRISYSLDFWHVLNHLWSRLLRPRRLFWKEI